MKEQTLSTDAGVERRPGQAPPASPGPALRAPFGEEPLAAWLALTCGALPGTLAGIIVSGGAANQGEKGKQGESGQFVLAAAWPPHGGRHLVALSERCLAARAAQSQDAGGAVSVACPLFSATGLAGVLVLELAAASAGHAAAIVATAARHLSQVFFGHHADDNPLDTQLRREQDLLARICGPEVFPTVALDTVNWLAVQLACSRVSLGMAGKHGIVLQAMSHAAWFDPRAEGVNAIEQAMEEAFDQRRTVSLPPVAGMQSTLSIAHRAMAQGNAMCSVVLAGGRGFGAGVLCFERPPGAPFSALEIAVLEKTATLIGPVLEAKQQAWRWLGQRSRQRLHHLTERLRDPRRPALAAGLMVVVTAVLALTMIDTGWRVSADAAIEGELQRSVPAPFEGFISSAAVRAGQQVRKGEPLAELDTRQIRLDLQRWQAEQAQRESQYRDALARHERPASAIALAQVQQAQAQLQLAEQRLEQATLVAPFDAYVVAGDLSQLIGSPVEQGKVLFELAPLAAYRAVLKVDEHEVRAIRVGQHGKLLLSGMPDEPHSFVVSNIAAAEAADGRNVFRVEARLDRPVAQLRPGMQGVGKIEAGQRSLLWIWTHSAWNWLQLQLWKWRP